MKDLRRTNWVSDLGDLASDMAAPVAPVVPITPLVPGDLSGEITVSVKGTGEAGRTAEDSDQ
jgi:hypothetical protein